MSPTPATTKPHVDHIGIIVADLDQAIATFTPVFGGPPVTTKTLADAGIRIAEFEAANITVELIEYCEAGDSFAKTVMGAAEGINHLSLRVDDVGASIQALAASGVGDGWVPNPWRPWHRRLLRPQYDARAVVRSLRARLTRA